MGAGRRRHAQDLCKPSPPPQPSALHMLSVFMKFLAQLQTWEPLVLLQSWEQVPKRRHSLTSGQREGRGHGGTRRASPSKARFRPSLGAVLCQQGSETPSLPQCPEDTVPDTPATPGI